MSLGQWSTTSTDEVPLNMQVSIISSVAEPASELVDALYRLSLPSSLLSDMAPDMKKTDILPGFDHEVWKLFTCEDRYFSASLVYAFPPVDPFQHAGTKRKYYLVLSCEEDGPGDEGKHILWFTAKLRAELGYDGLLWDPVFHAFQRHAHERQIFKLYGEIIDAYLEHILTKEIPKVVFEVEIEWARHASSALDSPDNCSPISGIMPKRAFEFESTTPTPQHTYSASLTPTHEMYTSHQHALTLVIRVPDLLFLICEYLDMGSVHSLRATCRFLHRRLFSLSAERMMRLLKCVFQAQKDVHDFGKLLRATDAIIGGSTTLAVLSPTGWQPGDLDVIVHEGHEDMVLRFLDRCGFTHEKDKDKVSESPYAVMGPRFKYKHYSSPCEGVPGIDLSVVNRERPAEFILLYHSTIVMNFWNGHHLYCLWPHYTFAGLFLQNYVTTNMSLKMENAIQKYRDRGYHDVVDERGRKISVQDLCYPDWADPQRQELRLDWIPSYSWRQPLRLEPNDDLELERPSILVLELLYIYQAVQNPPLAEWLGYHDDDTVIEALNI
ncbi:hypothetical protein FISHEDRAFT_77223 [Fistulina hepatica ATCC 64428]|uniref:Uncharacterized protein n=1 Tax=Fistulina hepatica ATCC 64428 TaxID=1128425 RepID=A0A0D7A1D2_9AGAR|nr:hypothetical protein FISHEDRAFT_77223 [Fistulina hepatica ATCC 64428]